MDSNEIALAIIQCETSHPTYKEAKILAVCKALNDRLDELERELGKTTRTAKRAAYEAGTLANGGQPD